MNLDLIGANEKGLSVVINNQESLNCYVVASPRGRSPVALVGSPGSAVFSSTAGTVRGCTRQATTTSQSYWVIGTALYRINSLGTATSLGTVPGSGRVSMVEDGASVIVVNGTTTAYFYNIASSTFSTVTLPYAAYTVEMLDTYAIFTSDDQRWFISNVGDTDNYSALDFADEVKKPDPVLAVIEDHSEIFLMGTETIVPYFNSANVDFPFSQNTAGVVERGLYARFSVAKEDNTILFLGDDLVVYRLQGYTPMRVSNDSFDIQLSNLLKDGYESDLRNAHAFIYTDHGHKFYQLTVPNRITLVLDIATGEWHRKKHWDYETHHAVCYMKCFGKHLIGGLDGKVYEMSRSYYDDGGKALKRLRRTHAISIDDRLINWKKLKLLMDYGSTPLTSGQGSDPTLVLRWSDDYGRSWSSDKFLSLGIMGAYTKTIVKTGMGRSRNRIFEMYVTDPVPFTMIGAIAQVA